MKKKYKVKTAYGDHKVGAEVELDPENAVTKGLLQGGLIELVEGAGSGDADPNDPLAALTKTLQERIEATSTALVEKLYAKLQTDLKAAGAGAGGPLNIVIGGQKELDDPTEGYANFGLFAKDVRDSQNGASECERLEKFKDVMGKKLKAVTGQSEGTTDDGGILVPTQVQQSILKKTFETGDILSRVRKFPVVGNSMEFPAMVQDSMVDGARYGGVRAYWMDEAEQFTISKVKFTKLGMKLRKIGCFCAATDELLSDAQGITLGAFLSEMASEELNFVISDAIIRGDGNGKPKGILNSTALLTLAAEAGQPADTIWAENIDKMWLSCPTSSRKNAAWFINPECEPMLQKLAYKIPITNVAGSENVGGFGVTLYAQPGSIAGQPYGTLKGRPVIPLEWMSGLGDVGDIGLFDLQQYLMIVKSGIDSATSIHLRFDYGETVFRFTMRVDGIPWWRTPVTPYKTTTSRKISPFTVIAAR